MFKLLDGNGNGVLDSADFRNQNLWTFLQRALDKDHGGTIDANEW